MPSTPVYEHLSDCFALEGVTHQFVLMGDGNMHWASAMEHRNKMPTVHVRHEHCAVSAAVGYYSATGEVGVASVTCGPGFMQAVSALTSAARARIPLVLFAGEIPITARWYHQHLEQAPVAAMCGAHYIAAHSLERMHQYVREAFYMARHERRATVLGVPYDLQMRPMPELGPYQPSATVIPRYVPVPPNPEQIAEVAQLLRTARRPVIVAGRGAIKAGARNEVEALADRVGAMLATTLPARGLYDHSPHSLGVCGGFSRPAAIPVFASADLVVTFGASMSHHTLHGGAMFPKAKVVQVSLEPHGLHHGLRSSDIHVLADAKLAALALSDALERSGLAQASIRSPELTHQLKDAPLDNTDNPIEPGTLNPIKVFEELEEVIPKDYDIVSGTGHQSYFHTTMRGYQAERYHHIRDFGAVGNSVPQALGVAAARNNGRVVLFDGDGSLLMQIQELETLARHGLKLLIVCANDGAYGAEIHKLRADGLSGNNAVFGRPSFENIARGFGLRGATITEPGRFAALLRDYESHSFAEIWDVHISQRVMSPSMRRQVVARHKTH